MTEEELFHAALAKSPAERAAFLAQACAGNAPLRAAVEALLAAHEAPGGLLTANPPDSGGPGAGDLAPTEQHVFRPGGAEDAPAFPGPGSGFRREAVAGLVIGGRYTLVERIGEGGMGEVWVARQTEPVRRKVALKLIKTGMDSRAVLQRFEQERQALALMDHPNIARVLDGGMSATGQPFFVMELVNGPPLTRFCEELKLTLQQRLELFVPICKAVQHAHQKGIVHRDLKPANILVTLIDGQPVPKVIDFGVAKATSGKLTEETLSTGFGAVVGTLEYMSPEQAGFSGDDIDTRADIYSLGIILYELLTGLRPFDAKRLRQSALHEMIRIIREEEPTRPSTRLSTDESLPSLAAVRQIEPGKLRALLQGELDWVVMKCLEKQRDRRYETANALARDVERYLADEAVEARPPSAGYRMRKFIRRHKGQVIAASLVLLTLVGGVVGTGLGMVQARRANAALADKNRELADEQVKVQARFELAQQAIATFHTGVSEDALLKNEQFKELRTKLLKEAAGFYGDLEKLLEGQADPKSRKLLADGYFQLGDLTSKIADTPAALAVHRKALALRRQLAAEPGAGVETRLAVARSLGVVGRLLGGGTSEAAEAIRAFEEQRDIALALEAESPSGAALQLAAQAHGALGDRLQGSGGLAEAEGNFDQALAAYQKLTAAHPANREYQAGMADTIDSIAGLLNSKGRYAEALAAWERAQAIYQKLADENPSVVRYQSSLVYGFIAVGNVLRMLGRPDEALRAFQKAPPIAQRLVDAQPAVNQLQSDLAHSHFWLARQLGMTDQPQAALEAFKKVLTIRQRLADANPTVTDYQNRVASTFREIANVLSALGQPAEALAASQKAAAILQKLSEASPTEIRYPAELALAQTEIAWELFALGRRDEALATLRQARDRYQRLDDAHPNISWIQGNLASTQSDLGRMLDQLGRPLEALSPREEAFKLRKAKLGPDHPNTLWSMGDLARSYTALGRYPEAAALLEASLPGFQKLLAAEPANLGHPLELAMTYIRLGHLYARQQRATEALTALDAGLAIGQKRFAANPQDPQNRSVLGFGHALRGAARVRAGQPAEAAADLRRVVELWANATSLEAEDRAERARSLALLAGLGGDAKSGVTQAEAKAFADQSLAALADALKAGWTDLTELKEPDFDAVRAREDFQKLLAELAAKLPKPATAAPPSGEAK